MLSARINHLIFCVVILITLAFVYRGSATASTNFNTSPEVPNNSHYRTQVILIDLTSAFVCQLTGFDILNPSLPCLGVDRTTGKIGLMPNTVNAQTPIGNALNSVIGMMFLSYDIPIQTNEYTSYLASGFGIVKPAHAQASGFDNLSALIGLWKKVRDLTYLGFVLLFVIIGLGVMLRIKLDPRTVMTVQNQIPKAIIALILITFSYAIAGLLIDLMWVSTYTGINLLTDNITCKDGATLTQRSTFHLLDNPIHYVNNTLGCPFESTRGNGVNKSTILVLGKVVGNTLGEIVSTTILSIFGDYENLRCAWTRPSTYGNCMKLGFQEVLSWLIGFIMMLAIIVAVFVQLFKVWFSLIKSYLLIILYTIIAPVWIIAGLAPGNTNFGFTQWLRRMLAALTIYPTTIFLFLIAIVLASDPSINNPNPASGKVFLPPLIGNPNISDNIGLIIALGVILITPEIVNMMREMFKTSPSKYAPAAMAALGAGIGSATAPIKKGWGALTKSDNTGAPVGPLAYAGRKVTGRAWRRAVNTLDKSGKIRKSKLGTAISNYNQYRENLRNARYPVSTTTGGGNPGQTSNVQTGGQTTTPAAGATTVPPTTAVQTGGQTTTPAAGATTVPPVAQESFPAEGESPDAETQEENDGTEAT